MGLGPFAGQKSAAGQKGPVSCPTPAIIPVSKGGGRSVAQMTIRRAQPSESREVSAWIKAHHYTKRCPPGYVVGR